MHKEPSPEHLDNPLAGEEIAFRQQRLRLMKRLAGEYVAFYRGRLVDHDENDEVLASRLFSRLGDVDFYIARLELPPGICEVPSPELAG